MSSFTPLKDWFDPGRYHSLAATLKGLDKRFADQRFLQLTLEGLEGRSLMQRLQQTSLALGETLPGPYARQVEVLRALAPTIQHGLIACFLPDFVARYGRGQRAISLPALAYFTEFGSSEFAIRWFILDDPADTLRRMQKWTGDANEHVRRLASEGCRPRLPWGQQLRAFIENPNPLEPILDALRADPALYVRKSVANNLNDITKDHPQWVLERLGRWGLHVPETAWIAKRAARTLIKQGNPEALKLFGFGQKPSLEANLVLRPTHLELGQTMHLEAFLCSQSQKAQTLAIDYRIHYRKANGKTAPKVFKWKELTLAPGQTLRLEIKQPLRPYTTRRHYAGKHRVELQINGQSLAEAAFDLKVT